ncbi:hypothetical protein TNCV_755171 [Trichonephila clavipes]|nr:hypothetical protein TNCV_755171 [Trichonephila clavipes]
MESWNKLNCHSNAPADWGQRPTVPISVFMTLSTEVRKQTFQSDVQSDEKSPVFNFHKQAWYSFIDPLKVIKGVHLGPEGGQFKYHCTQASLKITKDLPPLSHQQLVVKVVSQKLNTR